jgi:hypothetical protein
MLCWSQPAEKGALESEAAVESRLKRRRRLRHSEEALGARPRLNDGKGGDWNEDGSSGRPAESTQGDRTDKCVPPLKALTQPLHTVSHWKCSYLNPFRR